MQFFYFFFADGLKVLKVLSKGKIRIIITEAYIILFLNYD